MTNPAKRLAWCILALGSLLLLLPGLAAAQATRTWVSGVGDDANPCSRTAPCKTFAGAISKTAADGEINCLDSGGFGAVTITKSIVIDCGYTGGVQNSGTHGVTINVAAGRVVLRNLTINGAGFGLNGVNVLAAREVVIDNVLVRGQAVGVYFKPNVPSSLVVTGSTVIQNSSHGIVSEPQSGALVTVAVASSTSAHNGGAGVRAVDGTSATVSNSMLSANTGNGAIAASTSAPATLHLDRVVSTQNKAAGALSFGAQAVITTAGSSFTSNAGLGVSAASGGQMVSIGGNQLTGNGAGPGSFTSTQAPQ